MELTYKKFVSSRKIFVLKQFKLVANQRNSSTIGQGSVIKSLVAEKCKSCEIYPRMCDAYREACFSKKKKS